MPVSAALILIALNAAFWLIFAVIAALGLIPAFRASDAVRWVMALLAFGVSGCLIVLVILLRRRNRLAFYGGMGLLAVIAVLSITDEFGLPDVISLLISLAALGLLLKDRDGYLK